MWHLILLFSCCLCLIFIHVIISMKLWTFDATYTNIMCVIQHLCASKYAYKISCLTCGHISCQRQYTCWFCSHSLCTLLVLSFVLQPHLSATVQAQRLSLRECQTSQMPASPWRTGDHRDAPGLRGWRLPSRTWNHWTSPWMKQLTWLRIVHSGDWCLCLALRTPSGACQKWMNEWSCNVICYRVKLGTCCRLISRT